MSLGEGFGVGVRWGVGGGFLWKMRGKGEGGGRVGGWGQAKEPESQCALKTTL